MPGLNSRHPGPDQSPGFLLWRVTNSWQSAIRRALSGHGLTHVQFVLLACLAWNHDQTPIAQSALAGLAGTDEMMTSQVLRRLEQMELVTRVPSTVDKRSRLVQITEAGLTLVNAANKDVETCDAEFFSRLGTPASILSEQLRRLTT
jgi:DNA-binding MarR family transcriptional regulator